jgi:Spy/CpxP family protein refolding chaperone
VVQHFSKKGVLILIISALLLANIGLLVSFVWNKDEKKKAGKVEEIRRGPGVIMNDFLANGIGFSSEQKNQADAYWQEHKKIMGQLFEEIEKQKVQYFTLLIDSTTNDSAINSAVQRIADKQKEIELRSYARFKNLRALCTPEQRARFDSLYPGVIKELMAFFHQRGTKKPKS